MGKLAPCRKGCHRPCSRLGRAIIAAIAVIVAVAAVADDDDRRPMFFSGDEDQTC